MTERKKKIEYVKPEILDLGPVTPAHGGLCAVGSMNIPGDCSAGGIADDGVCTGDGNSAKGGHGCLGGQFVDQPY